MPIPISVMNMTAFHDGTIDMCQKMRISPMVWSPLANGRLFKENSDQLQRIRCVLDEVGKMFDNASLDQVALAWLLAHPTKILPILGTRKPDRIKNAVGAENIKLSREQWFRIWSASTGRVVP